MERMINWQLSIESTPEPGREVILKNTTKVIFDKASGSRCKITKYSAEDEKKDIADALNVYDFDLWAYTDEGDQHE